MHCVEPKSSTGSMENLIKGLKWIQHKDSALKSTIVTLYRNMWPAPCNWGISAFMLDELLSNRSIYYSIKSTGWVLKSKTAMRIKPFKIDEAAMHNWPQNRPPIFTWPELLFSFDELQAIICLLFFLWIHTNGKRLKIFWWTQQK